MAQRTPDKKIQNIEWSVPPSPRSLEALYLNLREEQKQLNEKIKELKVEIKEFMKRNLKDSSEEYVRHMPLEEFPLLKTYDLFLEYMKEEPDARKEVHVVMVLDSSSGFDGFF